MFIWSLIYNVIAVLINMSPNRKIIGYSFKEQVSDILPAWLNSFFMFLVVYYIGSVLNFPIIFNLLIQVFFGIIIYVTLAVVFKMSSLKEVLGLIKR